MNTQSSNPSNSRAEAPILHTAAPAPSGAPNPPTVADRLYQLAALTAGIFLLATIL